MENISQDKTTIIIAHRISSVQNADNIIVLNNGLIEQRGNHTELIQQEGIYKDLYNLQIAENQADQPLIQNNVSLKEDTNHA